MKNEIVHTITSIKLTKVRILFVIVRKIKLESVIFSKKEQQMICFYSFSSRVKSCKILNPVHKLKQVTLTHVVSKSINTSAKYQHQKRPESTP